jgi:hypothetical protein
MKENAERPTAKSSSLRTKDGDVNYGGAIGEGMRGRRTMSISMSLSMDVNMRTSSRARAKRSMRKMFSPKPLTFLPFWTAHQDPAGHARRVRISKRVVFLVDLKSQPISGAVQGRKSSTRSAKGAGSDAIRDR